MAQPMLTHIRDRGTTVVPCLAALSIAVLPLSIATGFANVSHSTYLALRVSCLSKYMTPARVLFRIFFNVVVAIVYVTVNVTIGAVVSERPYVSVGDLWRCPEIDTMLTPRTSRLGSVATIIYLSTRALVAATWMDLSRYLGGGHCGNVHPRGNSSRDRIILRRLQPQRGGETSTERASRFQR